MRKELLILIVATTVAVLAGCDGGGSGSPPAPPDISGTWMGGGTFTYTYGGQQVAMFVTATVHYENMGNGQYRETSEISVPDAGLYETMEVVVTYANGVIHYSDGSTALVSGNRIMIDQVIYFGDIRAVVNVDLYRT